MSKQNEQTLCNNSSVEWGWCCARGVGSGDGLLRMPVETNRCSSSLHFGVLHEKFPAVSLSPRCGVDFHTLTPPFLKICRSVFKHKQQAGAVAGVFPSAATIGLSRNKAKYLCTCQHIEYRLINSSSAGAGPQSTCHAQRIAAAQLAST